jgi:hypothetical protein
MWLERLLAKLVLLTSWLTLLTMSYLLLNGWNKELAMELERVGAGVSAVVGDRVCVGVGAGVSR